MSAPTGVVLLQTDDTAHEHELAVHRVLGEKLGSLLGCPFLGHYDPARHQDGRYYFLPDETLIGNTRAFAIQGFQDLFGGLVTEPFMATKAITHPLFEHATRSPPGWSMRFAEQAVQAILYGYTVFDLEDARRAAHTMLTHVPVRLKPVRGKAGRGQCAVTTPEQLDEALARQDPREIATWGLVLEENLSEPHTYSIGQVLVAGMSVSYYGTQRLTRDNLGNQVYGGSDLTLVRGNYEDLSRLDMPDALRLALQQARLYEQAAFHAYPGCVASRRNYDVARGPDVLGRVRCGVLEQSWRVGGASAAEIFALHAFSGDPDLRCIQASTHELYGDMTPPEHSMRLFQGDDPRLGRMSKYVTVTPYDCPK